MPSFLPDTRLMARAAFLAERGRGRTHPNPIVGAVVVSPDGVIVGQGAHLRAGEPHAEIHALDMAGPAAQGATLYCTLEPCCHVGRTGPCVERIVASGIRRVVTAIEDPNPFVAGKGHAWLRDHGVEVVTGVGADAARAQNAPFLIWITEGRPWTMLKTVVSEDGRVGAPRQRLSGPAADRFLHRQRAWIDALAVGAGTVLADDPQLTPRGAWRERPLTRVVIDWSGRVPASARVYSTLSAGPVIMVCLETVADTHLRALTSQGVRVERFSGRDLAPVSRRLGELGIQSLVVEGGPGLQDAWAASAPVDAVQWLDTAVPAAGGPPVAAALRRWREAGGPVTTRVLGVDSLVEGMWR